MSCIPDLGICLSVPRGGVQWGAVGRDMRVKAEDLLRLLCTWCDIAIAANSKTGEKGEKDVYKQEA